MYTVILKKEVRQLFGRPLVYVVAGLFLFILGQLFNNTLIMLKEQNVASLTYATMMPLFGQMNFLFLFFTPLLTMNTISGEARQGTLLPLLGSCASSWDILLAKFSALGLGMLFLLSVTFVFPVVLFSLGYGDWGPILTGYLGTYLIFLCYVCIGIFTSALTQNTILAGVYSFFLGMVFILLAQAPYVVANTFLGSLLKHLSLIGHFESFSRGTILSTDIIFLMSFMLFFLYLSKKKLEMKDW